MQNESFIRIENLNNTLRSQRHDFLNNLQVVYSLMELDEYEDAKEYIERIKKTLNRILEIKNEAQESIISKPVYTHKNIDKLIIKNKDGISFIDISSIILVQREERNTVIYTNNSRYITSEGLGNIEERLEKTVFYRSHKSYIINLSKISKIYPYGRWTYIVKLQDIDKDALITHKKYAELESIFLERKA